MDDELRPGPTFAGFLIDEVAGRGATSVVYRARDVALARTVALKVMSVDRSGDPTFRRRFAAEARTASRLDHPNVVPVYGFGEEDGRLFLAMRYVPGGLDLADRLESTGRLAPPEALDLLGQAARALDAVHRAGLVHGDVKPANLLLAPGVGGRSHVYLADFGLADDDPSATRPTTFAGTVAYAAPELVGGAVPTPAGDVYALTAVLVQCLTGSPPFLGDTDAAVLYGHLHLDPPSVHERDVSLPAALDAVIASGLAKDPAQRPGRASELVAEARSALGISTAATPVVAPPPDDPALAMPDPDEVTRIRQRLDDDAFDLASSPPDAESPGPSATGSVPGAAAPRRSRAVAIVTGAAVVVLVLLVVTAVVVSRRGESGPTTPAVATGGTATVLTDATPVSWKPSAGIWSADTTRIASAVFDPLVVARPGSRVEPWLAESVTTADAGFTWRIVVRDGVRFSDGRTVDAAAVAKNLQAAKDAAGVGQWLEPVDRIEVADPRTVVVTMTTTWARFDWALTTQVGLVASPATIDGADDAVPAGSGPFTITQKRTDGRVSLARNPAYWRSGLPHLDGLELQPLGGDLAATLQDGTGPLALLPQSATGGLQGYASRPVGRSVVAVAANVGMSPPTVADPQVRRALAAVTTRDRLAVGTGVRVVDSPFTEPPWDVPGSPPTPDADAGRSLVSAGVLQTAAPLQLTANRVDRALAETLAKQWTRAGIPVAELQLVDGPIEATTTTGAFQLAVTRVPTGVDPDLVEPLLTSIPAAAAERGAPAPVLDITRFVRSDADEPLRRARSGGTDEARREEYATAVTALNAQLGYVWLFAEEDLLVTFAGDLVLDAGEPAGSPFATVARSR